MQVRPIIVEDEQLEAEVERPAPALRLVADPRRGPARVRKKQAPAPTTQTAAAPAGYSGVEEHSTRLHSVIEHTMLFAFPPLFAAVFYHSAARLYELELLWLAALALPLSFVLGDLLTGVVHWAADTYGTDETPVIGHSLIRPFRLHHLYPKDITTHNVVTTLGNSCIMGVPLMGFCLFFVADEEASGWLAFASFVAAVVALVTVATNQFHKWAHQDAPPRLARLLQRARLVLTPDNHQTHHTEPFDSYYCITNGWLNPLLRRLRFFRGMEAALRSVGIRPTGRKQ